MSLDFLKFISSWPKYVSQKHVSNRKSWKLKNRGPRFLRISQSVTLVLKMNKVNVIGSILDNNLFWILKMHLGSPENRPGSQLVKITSSQHRCCELSCSSLFSFFKASTPQNLCRESRHSIILIYNHLRMNFQNSKEVIIKNRPKNINLVHFSHRCHGSGDSKESLSPIFPFSWFFVRDMFLRRVLRTDGDEFRETERIFSSQWY